MKRLPQPRPALHQLGMGVLTSPMPRPHARRCLRQTITLEEGIAMAVVHETGEPGSTA
ncbi:MAG TPA: hypothetical protein VEV45_02935 [Streptosporangiaceae bacterium]|nr:hypothetical protein [Streptosporangiaceae bacterium]